MQRKIWAAVLSSLLIAAPAGAVPLNAFSSFYVLGDSLSDVGNAYDASRGRIPESPPYWHGRFSNGRVWADRVGGAFKAEGVRTGNLAWGGALADGPGVPDIGLQVTQFRLIDRDKRGDRPLVSIWGGGNDILDAAGKARARREGRDAASAIGDAAMSLTRAGVRDLMLFDMPNLGEIPKFGDNADKSASARAASRAFNRRLSREIATLEDRGVNVYTVGVWHLFNALLEDPRSFGVANVTTPCLDEDDNPCTRRQGRRRAFFDEIHPNRVVHRAIAEAALDSLAGPGAVSVIAAASPAPPAAAAPTMPAPVPLPASGLLLVAAVGAAGLLRVRRRGPV
jgi:outer membrane lipase/esterase